MNTSFEGMSGLATNSADLTGNGDPERLIAGAVSPAFFDVLRVKPLLGRTFAPEEAIFGKHRVIVLGHRLWVSRFGSDRGIVGRSLMLNGNPWQVIGVLPATLEFPESIDQWGPLVLEGTPQPPSRTSHGLTVYARMKPGVTLVQARADMERVGALLQQQYPQSNRNHSAWVIPFEEPLQAIAGLTIGLTGGVLLMRTFQSMLYQVRPADPLTLAIVGMGLFATAIAACALPARRAMRVDPVTALRS